MEAITANMSGKQDNTVTSFSVAPYSSESARGQSAEWELHRDDASDRITLKTCTRDPGKPGVVTSMCTQRFSMEEARELKNQLEDLISYE